MGVAAHADYLVCFNPNKLEHVDRITFCVPEYVSLERLAKRGLKQLIKILNYFCQLMAEKQRFFI